MDGAGERGSAKRAAGGMRWRWAVGDGVVGHGAVGDSVGPSVMVSSEMAQATSSKAWMAMASVVGDDVAGDGVGDVGSSVVREGVGYIGDVSATSSTVPWAIVSVSAPWSTALARSVMTSSATAA